MPDTLLLVDDEETILESLSDFFTFRGYEVDRAADLHEAQRLLDAHPPDVVIADLRLSGSDSHEGLELLDQARRKTPPPLVLILSAFASTSIAEEALLRGASAVVQKPVPLPDLAAIVAQVLAQGAEVRRLQEAR